MAPSSGFYCQDVYDQALSLEKEVLKHARITATKKAIEEGPLYAILYYSKNKKEVIISNELVRLKLEGDKLSVTVDGETIDTIRLNPDHIYAYIDLIGESGGIPIVPDIEHDCDVPANLLIIKNRKVYVFYHPRNTTTTIPIPEDIIPVDIITGQAVGIDFGEYLKGSVYQPDFILGVDHRGDIIVFYVYRISSKEFFRLYCDLSSGRVWKGSPSSEELEKLKNLASRVDEELGGLEKYVGMNILYDIDDDKVIMVVWNAYVGDINITEVIKECNPRLYEFVKFLNSIGSLYDSYSPRDYFRLCAKAFEFKDLLEESGLIESKPVRLLLRPWLLPSAYVITGIPYLMTSLACSILLERLPRLGEPPEFRLDPGVIMDYAKRASYAVIIFELLTIEYYVAGWVSKLLARIWLGDDKLASNVWDDVRSGVGAPVIEEPLKRLASELTGLSRLLTGALYGFYEWVGHGEAPSDLAALSSRLDHAFYTMIPLPVGVLLHSLYNSGTSLDYWTRLLTPILSIIEGLIINAITGVW